jgi:hypothetical protein
MGHWLKRGGIHITKKGEKETETDRDRETKTERELRKREGFLR